MIRAQPPLVNDIAHVSLQGLVGLTLDVAYLAVFVVTLRQYVRRPERVTLAVVLVFGSLAVVLLGSLVRGVSPLLGSILGLLSLPAFLAQPLLALWLVHQFRPVARPIFAIGIAAFAGLVAAIVVAVASGATTLDPTAIAAFLVAFLVYYLTFELIAAGSFALEARHRGGTSRLRLEIAAASTVVFGLAIAVLVVGGVLTATTDLSGPVTIAIDLLAIASALGYLVAFAPPPAIQRLAQQSIAYDFIRELNPDAGDGSAGPIWDLLSRTAMRASGAKWARVELQRVTIADPPTAGSDVRIVEIPLVSDRWPGARLELAIAGQPLFVQDDLQLIRLLADRAVKAAERHEFVRERERLIGELKAASAAKSDFLASMSHELRTPLNAVIGFSELLSEPPGDGLEPAAVAEYGRHIHEAGIHLLELVNEVLDLARVEAGRLELRPVAFNLGSLVRQTVETMAPLADRKHLSVKVEGDEAVQVVADPARIRQVAFNLISNAVKFTPDFGAIRLTLGRTDDDVWLVVSDSGPGIAEADRDRIFEAFEQGHRKHGSKTEGTGLGLALTRRLVEAHGGRIELASTLGVGSAFTIHLPSNGAVAPHRPAPRADGLPQVLVIEDDPGAAELLRLYLDAAGYAVAVTASGLEGLAWAAESRPDAIVLDILLPDVDGWEVLQRLKREPATRAIPVVVVSVLDDRPLGVALGAVDYFVKPVARDSLLDALGRLTFTTQAKSRVVTALVIDADAAAETRYRELLEPEGFRVVAAAAAADGRDAALNEAPDLILLDLLLPDGDGFDLVARLKADPKTSSIPIWVTAPADLDERDKERLTGDVLGIVQRGDAALGALRAWLNPVERPTRRTPGRRPAREKAA